jgi:CBS-domain-containing membrane protein
VEDERREGLLISWQRMMILAQYLSKMKGGAKSPPGVGMSEHIWSWLGSAIGIGMCGYLSSRYFEPRDLTLLIGSFGASAVLVYGAIKSPLAQPRNLIGGHVLSGLTGVACYHLFGNTVWLAAAMAVSLAIVVMLATKTLHPPGGATALIAVIGGTKIHNLGFLYALIPAGTGAVTLLVIALLVNNLSKSRKYPEYWM